MDENPINEQADRPMNKSGKRMTFYGCLVLIVILIGLVIVGNEVLFRYSLTAVKEDPSRVPRYFSGALKRKDYRRAKALVSPEIWPEIKHWMDAHEQVKCPLLPQFKDDEGQGSGIGRFYSENDENFFVGSHDSSTVCPDFQHYYCFNVINVRVEQERGEWVITDVEEIEEYWSDNFCYNP